MAVLGVLKPRPTFLYYFERNESQRQYFPGEWRAVGEGGDEEKEGEEEEDVPIFGRSCQGALS